MATKEVYCKATVVDNESHKVSQMEDETQDTIAKPKSETKDQKKTSGIWTYFEIYSCENNKVIFLTCKEKISQGGSKPTKFNTSNLREHLMTHKVNISILLKTKRKGKRQLKGGNGVEHASDIVSTERN